MKQFSKAKFGEQITMLREKAKISQKLLSEKAGVSESSIQRIEAGDGNPELNTLIGLADYFKVPITELFANQPSSPESLKLISLFGRVSDRHRSLVIGTLESFAALNKPEGISKS
jgi:transcriptional regulator with XRE-family HTH domain